MFSIESVAPKAVGNMVAVNTRKAKTNPASPFIFTVAIAERKVASSEQKSLKTDLADDQNQQDGRTWRWRG